VQHGGRQLVLLDDPLVPGVDCLERDFLLGAESLDLVVDGRDLRVLGGGDGQA
jgi:hypothetical protein